MLKDYTIKVLSNNIFTSEQVNEILADNDEWYQKALRDKNLLENCYYDLMLETKRISLEHWEKYKGLVEKSDENDKR